MSEEKDEAGEIARWAYERFDLSEGQARSLKDKIKSLESRLANSWEKRTVEEIADVVLNVPYLPEMTLHERVATNLVEFLGGRT